MKGYFEFKSIFQKDKLFIIIILISFLSNFIVYLYFMNEKGRIPTSPDSRLYLDISLAIRTFSSEFTPIYTKNDIWRHIDKKKRDIGYTIMPGYPLLISPFNANLLFISLFQILLFSLSLYYLFKSINNKYLKLLTLICPVWLIFAVSYPYNFKSTVESTSISFLTILIYSLDIYLKNFKTKNIISFSILFGILISLNNRYIFHFCGFILFLLILKIFEKQIKFKQLLYSFLIVTIILTPWHVRQYIVHGKFVLFSVSRSDRFENSMEQDRELEKLNKIKLYREYLIDSTENPLRNNHIDLQEAKLLYQEKMHEDSLHYFENKKTGSLADVKPIKVIFEPSKKSIEDAEKKDLALKKNKGGELVEKRKELFGIKPVSIASNNTGDEVEDVRIVNYDEFGNIVGGIKKQSKGGKTIEGNKTESNQRELLIAQNKIKRGNNKKNNSKQEQSIASNIREEKSKPLISNNNPDENKSVNKIKNEKQNIISENNTIASKSKPENNVKNTNVNSTKTDGQNNSSSNLLASATKTENKTINIPEGVAKLAENNIIRSVIRANPVSQKVLADFIIKNNLIVKSISVAGIMEELNKLKYTDSVKYNELMLQIVDLYKNKDSEYRKIIKEENLAKAKTISQSNQEITKKDENIVNKSTIEVKKENVTKKKVIYIDSLSILVKQLEKELNKKEPVLVATNESKVAVNEVKNSNKTVKPTIKENNQQIKQKTEPKQVELTDAEIQKREEEKLSKFMVAKLNTKEQKIISPEDTDKRNLTTENTGKRSLSTENRDKTRNQKEISVVSDKTKLSTANMDKTGSQKEIGVVIDKTKLFTENIDRQKSATTQTPNPKPQNPIIAKNVETSKPVGKSVAAKIEQKQIAKSTESTDKSKNQKEISVVSDKTNLITENIDRQKSATTQTPNPKSQTPVIAKNIETSKPVGKTLAMKTEQKQIAKSTEITDKNQQSIVKSQNNTENQKLTTDNQQQSISKKVETPKQVGKSITSKLETKSTEQTRTMIEKPTQPIAKETKEKNIKSDAPAIAKNAEAPKQVGKSITSKVETKPIEKSKNLITNNTGKSQQLIVKSQQNTANQKLTTDNRQPAIAKNVEVPKQVGKSVSSRVETKSIDNTKKLNTDNTDKRNLTTENMDKGNKTDNSQKTTFNNTRNTAIQKQPIYNQTPIQVTKLDTQIVITKKVVKDPLKLANDTKSSNIATDTIVVIKRSESFTGLVKVSNKYKEKISYDTVPKSMESGIINSNQEKLNHPVVAFTDNNVSIIIQDMKVQRLSVFGFEDELEFRKFELLRKRKLVYSYDQLIEGTLWIYPKLGSTPENLQKFLSDFSYDKYRRLVYEKFEPTNRIELIWNRFKEQFIFYRFDFGLYPQGGRVLMLPSHYNNWINWMLELIMVPLVIINIIPLIIAIYKKDWLIISLAVLVFLHILLHALVGYIPRYRVTIYPAWITFAVYGYDQLTRYLIHIYKNRKDYSTRLLDIFTRKQISVN